MSVATRNTRAIRQVDPNRPLLGYDVHRRPQLFFYDLHESPISLCAIFYIRETLTAFSLSYTPFLRIIPSMRLYSTSYTGDIYPWEEVTVMGSDLVEGWTVGRDDVV